MEDYRAAIENLSLDQLTKNLRALRESGMWESLKPSERNALRKEYKAAFDFLSRRDEVKAKIEGLSAIEQEDAENARMAQELRKEGGILGNLTRDFARGVATTPASAARVAGFALDRLGAKGAGSNLTEYAQNVEDTANVLYPAPLPDAGMVEKIGSAAAENLVPMLATGLGTKSALQGIGRLTQAPRALKAAEIVGTGVGMSAPEILRESTTFDEYGNPQLPKNATPIIAGSLMHGAIETGLGISPASLVTKGKGKFLTGLFAKDTIKRIATLNKRYGPAETAKIIATRIFKDTPLGDAIAEGAEEVLQSPVTILAKNLANADVKEALTKSFDEMANLGYLESLGEEFTIGAAVGGIYGGARTTIDKIDNAIESKKTSLKEKQELAKQKEQLLLESDRTRREQLLLESDRTRRQGPPPDVIYSPVSDDYKEQRPGLLEAIDRRLIEYDRTRRQDPPPDVVYSPYSEGQSRKLIGTGEIPRAIETYRTQARSVPPAVINVPPTSDNRPLLELLNEMNNAKKVGDTETVNRIIDLVNARQSQTSIPRKMERPAPQEVSQPKAIKEVEKKLEARINEDGGFGLKNGKPFPSIEIAKRFIDKSDFKTNMVILPHSSGKGFIVAPDIAGEQFKQREMITQPDIKTQREQMGGIKDGSSESADKPETQKKPRALIESEDKKEPEAALKTNAEIKTNKRSGKALAHSPSGRSLNVRYDAISADDLITSDMPEFPKELQPRDRTTLFSADQISKIAHSPIINKLITDYPDADTGSPIVVPYKGKYVVLSGNGRTMGMRQGYEFGTMEEYKERLNNEGREYGIQNITENKPIFVRVLEGEHSQEELKELAIDLNRDSKLAMSAGETANVDADAVRKYAHLVTNFSDITSTKNWEFLQSFFSATTVKSDLPKFISRDRGLTSDGVAKLERALFAGAYGDGRIATMFAEDPDPNVANIINGMLNAAPAVAYIDALIEQNNAYDLSISRTVAETVDELSRLRLEGKSIKHYFLQPTLPGVQQWLSKTGEDLLRIFDKFKHSGKKITDFLVGYCDVVKKLGSPLQPTFEEVVIPTRAEIMQAVIERILGNEQPDLFSSEAGSRISFKENDGLGGQSRQAVEQSAKTKPVTTKETKQETPVKEETSETNVEGTSSLQEVSEKKITESKEEIKQKEKKNKEKPKEKIEDFGEVLEGAKKHYAAEYASSLGGDADASDVPLSKFWPVPNYEKLIQSGIPKDTVSLVRAIRETLPKKPRSMYKSTLDWSYYIKLLRGEAARLLSGEITVADFKSAYKKLPTRMLDLYDLYNAVGHESPLTDFELKIYLTKGERVYAITEGRNFLHEGKTREEVIEAFKQKLPDHLARKSKKGRMPKLNVYVTTSGPDKGKAFIGVKVGTNLVKLKRFDNAKEAREYLQNNMDELIEMLSKYKELPDVREKVNRERQGKDRRGGKDITPEDFSKAFGFRGVQFGNWVESEKRQEDLNSAYDALLDLAEIINVPPKALSLNGSLGLAFGARGSGGKSAASAHYEPAKVVINLTKKKGAGSLAHEWFHALDNYFGKKTDRNASEGMIDRGEREEVKQAFADLMNTIMRTELPRRSSEMDKRRSNQYWSTRVEMVARAFESYVINKLETQAYSNDYLANIKREHQFDAIGSANMYPYLKKSEVAAVVDAFDNLFNTLKTEETEKGIRLYSAEYLVAKYAAKGIKQAKKIIQRGLEIMSQGIRDLSGWAKQMLREFGQNIKDYIRSLYKDLGTAFKERGLHSRRGAISFKDIRRESKRLLKSKDFKWEKIDNDTYLLQFTSPVDGEVSTVAKLARNKTGKGSHRWIWVGSKYVFLDARTAKSKVKSRVFEKMKRSKAEKDKAKKIAKMVEQKEREEIEKAKAYMAEGDNRTAEVKLPKTYKDRVKHFVNRAEEVLFDIWSPVRRLQEEAKNKIGEIPDSLNLYQKLELVSGKIEEHVKSAKSKYLDDVKNILIKNGIEVKKFNRFLYVSHAEERNKAIDKLEGSPFKRLGRPGSGISTEQARKELEEFAALPNYAAYKEAAEITYKLNNFLLDEQVRLGLLTQEQRDHYRKYKKYTPLKSPPDQGLILDRRALGRRSQASEQLAFIEQSIYAVYNRGFKKDISSTAIKLFKAFPNEALYERVKPKKVQYINKKGKVTVRQEMEKFFGSPEMLWAKDPATGDYVVYKIKDESLRKALVNNFKEDTIETNFFRFFKRVNNWLAATATAWNPEFIYTNLIRDVQQGAAGVGVMLPEGSTVKFLSNLKRARQAITDDKAGKNTEDAILLKEYKLAGGKTGYSEFSRLEERASNLEREVSQAIKGGKLHNVKQSLKKAFDFISEWNDAIETRTRFAGYLTAKEAGFSTQKAAAFAKNMTVNFNKKGSWAPILNSLYLFSSANLGGNLVTAKVLAKASKTKKGKAMIAAAVTLGFVSEIINSLIAGDDDEDGVNYYDKVADYVKDSNFVFMIPGGKGKYVAIPMPYGLNVLPSIGRNMAASMFGRQTAKDGAANMIGNLLDAFNPLGGDRRSLLYHVVPTAARPFVDVATNTTWTGRKIRPEQEVFGSDVARAELYYADNSKVIREISKFLNEISGGDRYKSGFLDFLTPGEIEHLLAQSTGGVGKTITRAADLVTKSEKELTLNTLPIMRRFINSSNDYQSYETFRANTEMVKDFERAKREKDVEWLRDKRWLVLATEKFKRIQKITTQINKSKLSELQKRERLLKEMKGFNKYFDKLKSKVLSKY